MSEYTCAYVALCTIRMSRWNARLRWSYSAKCVCYVCNYIAGLCVCFTYNAAPKRYTFKGY